MKAQTQLLTVALLLAAPCIDTYAAISDAPNWQEMFHRDEARPFERYPEDIYHYIQQGEGWYMQFNSTTVGQTASNSKTDRDNLLNTAYDLSGGWEPIQHSMITWWLRGGRPIGETRNADLSEDIGSVLDVNGSLEGESLYLKELYWSHAPGKHLRYSLGVIDSTHRYDFNTMANNEHTHFLSLALINSPAIPLPESSLAADLVWQFNKSLVVHTGAYQSNCKKTSQSCFKDLNSNDWLIPLELIVSTNLNSWGEGHYRFLAYTSRDGDKSGNGLSVNFDQEIGRFIPFMRMGVADGNIADVDRFFSLGVGIDHPLGRYGDIIGVAVARGRPTDAGKRTETLFESYWRFRLNPYVSLSPDVQVVFDPANNPDKDRVTVLGLRLQLDF